MLQVFRATTLGLETVNGFPQMTQVKFWAMGGPLRRLCQAAVVWRFLSRRQAGLQVFFLAFPRPPPTGKSFPQITQARSCPGRRRLGRSLARSKALAKVRW
jgi:hypothetical protein